MKREGECRMAGDKSTASARVRQRTSVSEGLPFDSLLAQGILLSAWLAMSEPSGSP